MFLLLSFDELKQRSGNADNAAARRHVRHSFSKGGSFRSFERRAKSDSAAPAFRAIPALPTLPALLGNIFNVSAVVLHGGRS
jgi:hypothetical protein